jgi:hypothetical protein
VFKNGIDNSCAYDIDGKIFIEPDGCAFTNRKSHVRITFPYTPKTKYIDVDDEGNEIE